MKCINQGEISKKYHFQQLFRLTDSIPDRRVTIKKKNKRGGVTCIYSIIVHLIFTSVEPKEKISSIVETSPNTKIIFYKNYRKRFI